MPAKGTRAKVKKVVLAYSGGLDTSIILKWLQETYKAEVITFTADLGQGEELEPARLKAEMLGISKANIFIEDLREEFIRDYVFPMFRANALYEGVYLLGTSIARPLIAKTQIDIARKTGADAVCHGATGKGNDQVRFELSYYALEPSIRIIAPWRDGLQSARTDRLCGSAPDPVAKDKRGEARSRSTPTCCTPPPRGRCWRTPPSSRRPTSISAPSRPWSAGPATDIVIGFKKGDAVSLDGKAMSPATLFARLNELGRDNGIGRVDLVENRFVGMKSRGVTRHRAHHPACRAPGNRVDHARPRRRPPQGRADAALRRADLQRLLVRPRARDAAGADRQSQEHVEGLVRLKLYKGNVIVTGREAQVALLDQPRDLRGRQGRLRPEGRGGVHTPQRTAAAHAGDA
jgi:argininosuccinate synthase